MIVVSEISYLISNTDLFNINMYTLKKEIVEFLIRLICGKCFMQNWKLNLRLTWYAVIKGLIHLSFSQWS